MKEKKFFLSNKFINRKSLVTHTKVGHIVCPWQKKLWENLWKIQPPSSEKTHAFWAGPLAPVTIKGMPPLKQRCW